MNKKISNESGNAIVWVLIAVALFAALNYAFSSTSRTSTSLLTNSEADAYASQIIAYGNEVKAAVKRMQLRSVDETEFSFGQTADAIGNAPGHNPNCTTNKCEVFHIEGGQLQPKIFENGSRSRAFFIDGVGTAEPELMLTIFDIGPETCLKINEIFNIGTVGVLPVHDTFSTDSSFDGTYTNSGANILGEVETSLSGQKAFCSQANIAGNYHFHQVLIAR